MKVTDSKLLKGFTRMCQDGFDQGWHERNGGNLSYRMKDEEVKDLEENFSFDAEWKELGTEVPTLKNEYFITKKRYETIHIVGGGSNAEWLNELTAKETGLKVIAGPGEATAIGNIGAQMIASGVYEDLWMFRKAVSESFDVKCYES